MAQPRQLNKPGPHAPRELVPRIQHRHAPYSWSPSESHPNRSDRVELYIQVKWPQNTITISTQKELSSFQSRKKELTMNVISTKRIAQLSKKWQRLTAHVRKHLTCGDVRHLKIGFNSRYQTVPRQLYRLFNSRYSLPDQACPAAQTSCSTALSALQFSACSWIGSTSCELYFAAWHCHLHLIETLGQDTTSMAFQAPESAP
jgi:hypothetical protein